MDKILALSVCPAYINVEMFENESDNEEKPSTSGEIISYYIFIFLIFGGLTAEVFTNYEPVKLTILFFLLAWILLTFLHELGHALTARLFKWEVSEFVIGYGKVVKQFKYNETKVEFRMIPIGGYVRPKQNYKNWSRLKSAALYFAGPGIELLIFFGLWYLIGYGQLTQVSNDYLIIMLQGCAISAVTGAIINLIPHGVVTDKGNSPNDGLGILLSLFASKEIFFDQKKKQEH